MYESRERRERDTNPACAIVMILILCGGQVYIDWIAAIVLGVDRKMFGVLGYPPIHPPISPVTECN